MTEQEKILADIKKIEQKREKYIDKYILPLDARLEKLRDELDKLNQNSK